MTNIKLFYDGERHLRPNFSQEHFEKYEGPEIHTKYRNEGNEGNSKSNPNHHSTKVKRRIRQRALSKRVIRWGDLAN